MTCVIGLLKDKKIYMGADNVCSTKEYLQKRADPKVFIKDTMIFGCTSSYRMINLLQYQFEIPHFDTKTTSDVYMYTIFIEDVRKLFKNKGFTEINNNVETGGTFIVGFQNNLYEIQNDFQISKHTDSFCCIGTGMYFAYGAMKALQCSNLTAEEQIIKSLEISEYYDPFVRRPFTILNLDRKE
jgi:hypothetical protein